MRLSDRLQKLEARTAPVGDAERSAIVFWSRIEEYSARFDAEAAGLSRDALLRLSQAEHLAWSLRFDPVHSSFPEILAQRGDQPPPFYADGDEHL